MRVFVLQSSICNSTVELNVYQYRVDISFKGQSSILTSPDVLTNEDERY